MNDSTKIEKNQVWTVIYDSAPDILLNNQRQFFIGGGGAFDMEAEEAASMVVDALNATNQADEEGEPEPMTVDSLIDEVKREAALELLRMAADVCEAGGLDTSARIIREQSAVLYE